jgi:hypothetical protein
MASSFTTNKNIEKPAYNDYAANPTGWSGPINADWDIIDRGFGGVQSKSTTGSTPVNLNITETQNLVLIISGTLVANALVTLPLNTAASGIVAGQWIVKNITAGSFTVTISPTSGGGTSVVIPQGETVSIFSDGTNVAFADNPSSYITAAFAARSVLAGTAMTGGGALSSNVTLNADQATDANWRQNVANKLLNPNAVWSAMTEQTLVDGATVSWDMSTGFDYILTLGGNRTLSNPTSTKVGQKGRLIIQQDATGSRTVTWGANYKFSNGLKPTLSTAANAIDLFYYDVRSSSYIIVTQAGRAMA